MDPGPSEDRQVETTLLVPYTPGSQLQKEVQGAEDEFSRVVKSRRVRVVESGGDKLCDLLVRNDPWASKGVCDDNNCPPCLSRVWLQERRKQARKEEGEPAGAAGAEDQPHV